MGSFEFQKVSVLIFWCFMSPCLSEHVQLFDQTDFKGYKYEFESSEACSEIPEFALSDGGSVKTTGCVVFFHDSDCQQGRYVVQSDVPNLTLQLGTVDKVHSVWNCNIWEKSSQVHVNVDGYKYDGKGFAFHLTFPEACKCTNLPKIIRQSHSVLAVVNGWGKCINYYGHDNCQGSSITCSKHGESASKLIQFVKSFKPCEIQPHCVRLNATITLVEPLTDLLHLQDLTTTFSIAATETFQNNGSGILEEDYSVEKDVEESFHFRFAKEFSQMNSLTFDMGVKIGVKTSFLWGLISASSEPFQAGLSLKYQTNSSSTETKEYGITKTTKFKVAKKISVPPCTEYKVSSSVKVAKDVIISYRVEFKIMGVIQGDTRMKTGEIREHLNGLKYLRDLDEFTVVAETTAQMKATFGLETFTRAEGTIIDACVKANKKLSCNNINDLKINYVLPKNQVKNNSPHFWKRP